MGLDIFKRNTPEKLKKNAEKAEKRVEIEKNKSFHKLEKFFSKDQIVNQEQVLACIRDIAGNKVWDKKGKFLLPALSADKAKEKAKEFVNFYETSLKQSDKPHVCKVEPDENNINMLILINNAKKKMKIPNKRKTPKDYASILTNSVRIKEIDKLAKPYGKSLIKHWKLQKQLGKTEKAIPVAIIAKDGGR